MTCKIGGQRSSFNISRKVRWILMVILVVSLLLGVSAQQPRAATNAQFGFQTQSSTAQDQVRIAAERKTEEGNALMAQGTAESLRLAVKKYEESLLLWRSIGDHSGEAAVLHGIGTIHYVLGEMRKALDNLNQALSLMRTSGDRSSEAYTLDIIGKVHASIGEKQKALGYYNQSLSLWRAAGISARVAETLNNIGGVYFDLGEKRKALDFFNETLLLSRAVGDHRVEALALGSIGAVYHVVMRLMCSSILPTWHALLVA